MLSNFKYKVTKLKNNGAFALVEICMLDENGNVVPDSIRFIVFELPEWSEVLQTNDENIAIAKFNQSVKTLPNQAAAAEAEKDNLSSRSASTKGPQPWD